jgi:hypothetical protein
VCDNFDVLPHDVKFGSSLDFACKADWSDACFGKYKDTGICKDGKAETNLCALDQAKCNPIAAVPVDPCMAGWFECVVKPDWRLCDNWPELCSGNTNMPVVPTNPNQTSKFTGYYELEKYLCDKDKDAFCRGGTSLVFQDVCKEYTKLEPEVMAGSSIASICQADIANTICKDQTAASMICADGKINDDLCSVKPEACTAATGTSANDPCVKNWRSCINDPKWNFCSSFPEFCNKDGTGVTIPPAFKFNNGQELIDKICSADKAKWCSGGDMPNLSAICTKYHELPQEVQQYSTFYQACTDFDWMTQCYQKDSTKPSVCDNTTLKTSLCELKPDKCTDECVKNIYDCFAKSDWHGKFREQFPELVKAEVKPMEFKTGQEMIDYLCKADAGKFCGGGSMIEINAVCDNYHEIPDRESFEKGTSLMSICSEGDREKICVDPTIKDKVCPDGKTLTPSLCQLDPARCTASTAPPAGTTDPNATAPATNDVAKCANNVYDCFATN